MANSRNASKTYNYFTLIISKYYKDVMSQRSVTFISTENYSTGKMNVAWPNTTANNPTVCQQLLS